MRLYRMRHTGNRESDCPASAARRRGPGDFVRTKSILAYPQQGEGYRCRGKGAASGKATRRSFRASPRRPAAAAGHPATRRRHRSRSPGPGGASAARAQAQRRRPAGSLRAEPERAPPPGSGGASAAWPTRQGRRPRSSARARERQSERAQGRAEGKGAARAGGLPPEPPCDSMGLFFANAKYNRLDLTFLS